VEYIRNNFDQNIILGGYLLSNITELLNYISGMP
jgi:hypothetical protein